MWDHSIHINPIWRIRSTCIYIFVYVCCIPCLNISKKNPAYGRQRISRPMRKVGPILFWRGCMKAVCLSSTPKLNSIQFYFTCWVSYYTPAQIKGYFLIIFLVRDKCLLFCLVTKICGMAFAMDKQLSDSDQLFLVGKMEA